MQENAEGWPDVWAQFMKNLKAGWSWSGFERSAFFLNDGQAHFQNLSPVLGLDQVNDGRALASGDIDGDGDIDLVGTSRNAPHLYVLRNDVPHKRHFLLVDLIPSKNMSPAGARLEATAGGRVIRRDVDIGSGFLTQHSLTQHFGLGDADGVDRLDILWPDGAAATFTDLPVDAHLVLRQDSAEVVEKELMLRNHNATHRLPAIEWDKRHNAIQLITENRPDLSWLELETLQGRKLPLVVGPAGRKKEGPVLLVNLWATWCANCKAEMPDLSRLHAESPHGLRVVGLSLDEDVGPEVVHQTADQWALTFPVVRLSNEQRDKLLAQLTPLTGKDGLVLPTSMLLLPNGQVRALIQGVVEPEDLVRYLAIMR